MQLENLLKVQVELSHILNDFEKEGKEVLSSILAVIFKCISEEHFIQENHQRCLNKITDQLIKFVHTEHNEKFDNQCILGIFNQHGIVVNQDLKNAIEYFTEFFVILKNLKQDVMRAHKAADQNYGEALYKLAHCYLHGEGVKKDELRALDLAQKAAINGNSDAFYQLKIMYHKGHFVRKDLTRAILLLRKAIELKSECEKSDKESVKIFEEDVPNIESAAYYQNALKENKKKLSEYQHTLDILGFYFQFGIGIPQNLEQARNYYLLAQENGSDCWWDLLTCNISLFELGKISLDDLKMFYALLKTHSKDTFDGEAAKKAIIYGYLCEYGAPGFDQNFNAAQMYYEDANRKCMRIQSFTDCSTYQNYLIEKNRKYLLFFQYRSSIDDSCLKDLLSHKGLSNLIAEYSFHDEEGEADQPLSRNSF